MLTPAEISGKEFEKVIFGGYDMTGVDDFLEAVTADYTSLYKENGILKNKLKVLVEKIEEYRSTEDAMRMALLTAQKMGDDLVAEAERKKEETLGDLAKEEEKRRIEIDALLADENARLEAAILERNRFVEASKDVIGTYLDFLSKISNIKSPSIAEPEPTKEDLIRDTANQIDKAIERQITDTETPKEKEEPPAEPEAEIAEIKEEETFDDESAPTRRFTPKPAAIDSEDENTSPRPKFDFEDLKFGINFEES